MGQRRGATENPTAITCCPAGCGGALTAASEPIEDPDAGRTSWPRFPLTGPGGEEPLLAVLYTPDDIGRTVRMESLGYPDEGFFRLHREHPDLKVAIMSGPANRYLGQRTILDAPRAIEVWRRIASGAESDWMELGGHGYTHSPPGDENLDHHEFSDKQQGCNIDHRRLARESYCLRQLLHAREVYRALGISDDRVIVMRFPGAVDTPGALRAARAAGFVAIFGRHHREARGTAWWLPCGPDCEMLDIEDSHLKSIAPSLESFVRSLAPGGGAPAPGPPGTPEAGGLDPAALEESAAFGTVFAEARRYVDRIASGGGILNISNHFWETFESVGGVRPRYLLLSALLKDIRERYGPRVWYPRARDLALWLELQRNAAVSWRHERATVTVEIEPPPSWAAAGGRGLEQVSIRAGLPAGFSGVVQVRLVPGGEGSESGEILDPSRYRRIPAGLEITFPLHGRARLVIAGAPSG